MEERPNPEKVPQRIKRPQFPRPEPLQPPRPGPQPLQAQPREQYRPPMNVPEIKPPSRTLTPVKPHVYVKVSSYKDIMERIDKMSKEVGRIRNLMNEMGDLTRQEGQKLGVFNNILSKLRDDLNFLESTFTKPEE